MKNKQNGFIGIALIIALLAVVAGGGAYVYTKKMDAERIQKNKEDSQLVKKTDDEQKSEDKTKDTSALKTYTNSEYGFTFSYPNNWKLIEDKSKKEVTINTNDIGGVNPENRDNPEYSSWSITFKVTNKNFFTPPIGTKFGLITYDEKLSTIVDGDICLKAEKLLGSFEGNNTSIQAIRYGGSLMSDPAYSNSAILTSNGEIIVVTSQQGIAFTPEIGSQLSKITNSFKLLNGNNVFVPTCAL